MNQKPRLLQHEDLARWHKNWMARYSAAKRDDTAALTALNGMVCHLLAEVRHITTVAEAIGEILMECERCLKTKPAPQASQSNSTATLDQSPSTETATEKQ